MKINSYILIIVALILNACGFSKTSDLVGEWGGEKCPFSMTFEPDGIVYLYLVEGFEQRAEYKVEGENVIINQSSGAVIRFKKQGSVLVIGSSENTVLSFSCEKQQKELN